MTFTEAKNRILIAISDNTVVLPLGDLTPYQLGYLAGRADALSAVLLCKEN